MSRQAFWPMAQASQLLPTPLGPTEREIVVGLDPFALRQLLEQGAVETAGGAIVDVLDARLLTQFCGAQPGGQAFVPPP